MKNLYLVAYYYQRPSGRHVRTTHPDWQKVTGATAWDEQVALTKNLKNKDYTTAKVILDMVNKRVLKNDWGTTKDFSEMFLYFHKGYPQYTADIMRQIDQDFLASVLPEFRQEIPASSGTISSS
jgi:hypothetical protein